MTAALQLDLFGQVEADETAQAEADRRRLVDGLTCLRDAHSRTLEILLGTRQPDRGEIKCGASGPWAYSVRKDGFHFEDRNTWGGWYTRPAHRITWAELDNLVGHDPRVPKIRTWSDSLTAIDSWKDRHRPFELWSDPGSWHPSYAEGDHARAGWAARHRAWLTVLQIFTDAIGATQ